MKHLNLLILIVAFCSCHHDAFEPNGPMAPAQTVPTPCLTYPVTAAAKVIGVNAQPNVPVSLLQPFYRIRQYQAWRYTHTPQGIATQPSRTGNINCDTYYQEALTNGHMIHPVVSWKLDWLTTQSNPEWIHEPMTDLASDPVFPFSYGEWSRYWWQITARYGAFPWQDQFLNVNQTPRWNGDPVNEKKTAMKLLSYVEPENETDRWWRPAYAQYTPVQCAAMMSAAYDGHMGQMGFGTGIRCADPDMKVVLPGLADIDTAYLQGIVDWSAINRCGHGVPFNVINVHWYCNAGNNLTNIHVNLTGPGVCPEADNLRLRLQKLATWRDRVLPGMEIWLSEFGWDTDAYSPQRCQPYGIYSQEKVQAMWITRAYLEGIAAGIDGMYLYEAANEPSNQGLFAASGVMSSEGTAFQKKEAYSAIVWLVSHLNGWHYDGDYSGANYRAYRFKSDDGQIKYCVWSPTADGSSLTLQTQSGTVTVTEDPIFIYHL
jgi:hypothetical protein